MCFLKHFEVNFVVVFADKYVQSHLLIYAKSYNIYGASFSTHGLDLYLCQPKISGELNTRHIYLLRQ